ncbi:hypothetical protein [Microbulbifer elongatus]|uniref:hypothetical protein n=1 Tax=Microbulbifer elongatus TaxID=86173 RepID=UPI001CFCA67C|nr:hypothetical protein [Microbulbifer elongatus]
MNSILANLQFILILMFCIAVIGGILAALYTLIFRRKYKSKTSDQDIPSPFPKFSGDTPTNTSIERRKQKSSPVDRHIPPLSRNIPDNTSVDGLLAYTKDWNGYRREEAIRRLDSLDAPGILSVLIERLNDWVPEVRRVAKAVFLRRLAPGNCTELVNVLPDIYRLAERNRDNHRPVICAVENCLIKSECRADLLAGLRYPDINVARACYDLLLAKQILLPQELLSIGLQSSDWHIRRSSLDCLKQLAESEIRPALSVALQDKFPPIRRIALRLLLERSPAVAEVSPFLFDRNTSVREIAVRHLLEREFPVALTYTELLQAPTARQQVIALWGVSKLHHEQAVEIATTKLESQFASVRREALECLARLDEDKAHPHIVTALFDESPGMMRAAMVLAKRLSIRPHAAELETILKQSHSPKTLQTCIQLMMIMDKWEALTFLLQQIGDDTQDFQSPIEDKEKILEKAVSIWSEKYDNPSLFAPYPRQRQALEAAIGRMPERAKAVWREWFEQLLSSI